MRVILASASPRRKELLAQLGFSFTIQVSGVEEVITQTVPCKIVEELSAIKARDVYKKTTGDVVVIGSDTIVAMNGEILGKPKDAKDAERMIRMLSGQVHQVYTGVTLFFRLRGKEWSNTFHECTDVSFYSISDEEINQYIYGGNSGNAVDGNPVQENEWADKAGAYAVQGAVGARFLKGMNGDYNNVVGLPVAKLYQELKKEGIMSELEEEGE